MNAAEVKLLLFREIDNLPNEVLLELKELVQKIAAKSNGAKTEQPVNRQFGSMKGLVAYMAPDFNAPLDDFKDYLPA